MNYFKYLWKTFKKIAVDLWFNPVLFFSAATASNLFSSSPLDLGFFVFIFVVAASLFLVPLLAVGTIWFFQKKEI